MSRTLVVVTCDRDRWGFELLCRTMQKYLQPCPVIFIINEEAENVASWNAWYTENCKPFLDKFVVRLFQKNQFWTAQDECHLTDLEKGGWDNQQVLKLCISKHVTTEHYLVLDSKNFFIRPTYIEEVKQIFPQPTDWCEDILANWIDTCLETFTLEKPHKPIRLTQNTTPYLLRTKSAKDLVAYFGGNGGLFKWFTIEARKDKHSPSEFFLYEIFTIRFGYRNTGDAKHNCVAMWEHMVADEKMTNQDFVKFFTFQTNIIGAKVAGIHSGLRKYWNTKDILFILKRLGVHDCMPKTVSPFSAK